MKDKDIAAAAVLRWIISVAALERLEMLSVAARGGDLDVSPAHSLGLFIVGCGCDFASEVQWSESPVKNMDKTGHSLPSCR